MYAKEKGVPHRGLSTVKRWFKEGLSEQQCRHLEKAFNWPDGILTHPDHKMEVYVLISCRKNLLEAVKELLDSNKDRVDMNEELQALLEPNHLGDIRQIAKDIKIWLYERGIAKENVSISLISGTFDIMVKVNLIGLHHMGEFVSFVSEIKHVETTLTTMRLDTL